MATIQTYMKMMDQFTSPLRRVTNQVNTAITSMERLRRLVETPSEFRVRVNVSDVSRARAAFAGFESKVLNVQVRLDTTHVLLQASMLRAQLLARLGSISATISATLNINSGVTTVLHDLLTAVRDLTAAIRAGGGPGPGGGGGGGGGAIFGSMRGVMALAGGYLGYQGVKQLIDVTDQYTNIQARINLVNDGLQTTGELQDKIFAAAERSRGSYEAMATSIGKMGILAEDAFKSNDELIAFTELMQKSFRVGGASTMEQQSGMYQLTQAMAAGKLQGDEFRSITENAPLLAQAIADVTGKTKGELKQMSADGVITADIIKAAMFNAADEINSKFERMPRTFADAFNAMKNTALQTFGDVLERINNALNSPRGVEAVGMLEEAIRRVAVIADQLITIFGNVYSFVADNWSYISPVVWGIVAALAAWRLAVMAVAIAQGIATLATLIETTAMFILTTATLGLSTAWRMLNAAMKANVIIFLISLLIGLAVWLVKLWQTNDAFAAGIIRGWNAVLNFFDQVPIFFVRVGYGVIDAFDTMKIESLKILDAMINGVIDGINWLIDKLNMIPGVSLDTIDNVDFAAKAAATAEAERQANRAAADDKISKMQADAAEKAANREQKVQDMLNDRAADRAAKEAAKAQREAAKNTPIDFGKYKSDIGKVGEVGKVGKVEKPVDISSEDLQRMRELAEMKSIQNFVTLTPIVNVTTGNIMKEVDVDTLINRIGAAMETEIQASAQGAYP